MFVASEPRGVSFAAILFTAVIGQAAGAKAQDCAALEVAATVKLEEFLLKKLAHSMSSKTIELIANWRAEYGSGDLLNSQWAQVNASIANQQLAAEQAELRYIKASDELTTECANGG